MENLIGISLIWLILVSILFYFLFKTNKEKNKLEKENLEVMNHISKLENVSLDKEVLERKYQKLSIDHEHLIKILDYYKINISYDYSNEYYSINTIETVKACEKLNFNQNSKIYTFELNKLEN